MYLVGWLASFYQLENTLPAPHSLGFSFKCKWSKIAKLLIQTCNEYAPPLQFPEKCLLLVGKWAKMEGRKVGVTLRYLFFLRWRMLLTYECVVQSEKKWKKNYTHLLGGKHAIILNPHFYVVIVSGKWQCSRKEPHRVLRNLDALKRKWNIMPQREGSPIRAVRLDASMNTFVATPTATSFANQWDWPRSCFCITK